MREMGQGKAKAESKADTNGADVLMWFKKRDPKPLTLELAGLGNLTINHQVIHKFEPRPVQKPPTSLTFICRNNQGQEWQTNPLPIYGQSGGRVELPPLSFFTDRPMDSGIQATIIARLYYEGN
jgi:hypothetical protein